MPIAAHCSAAPACASAQRGARDARATTAVMHHSWRPAEVPLQRWRPLSGTFTLRRSLPPPATALLRSPPISSRCIVPIAAISRFPSFLPPSSSPPITIPSRWSSCFVCWQRVLLLSAPARRTIRGDSRTAPSPVCRLSRRHCCLLDCACNTTGHSHLPTRTHPNTGHHDIQLSLRRGIRRIKAGHPRLSGERIHIPFVLAVFDGRRRVELLQYLRGIHHPELRAYSHSCNGERLQLTSCSPTPNLNRDTSRAYRSTPP